MVSQGLKHCLLRLILLFLLGLSPMCAVERIRIMAANTTSGNGQNYDLGHGIRIFQGLTPDIVLIQEFNYLGNTTANYRSFVDTAFGSDYEYYVEGGDEQIPNGVISRYPILQSGEWNDSEVSNRDFAWAQIDIPGDKNLWAVSVHFLTRNASVRNSQAIALRNFIQTNVPEDDYLVVGGDFNTGSFSESALSTLAAVVETDGRPDDQNGTTGTNASRAKPYDQVLPEGELEALEVPVVISGHGFTYSEGLVFDSRVFTPLSAVSPVLSGDSSAPSMQHMAVIRDFSIPTDEGSIEPTAHVTNFAGTQTSKTANLSWTDVSESLVPDGYLILAGTSNRFRAPSDGVDPTIDSDLSDGSAAITVNQGVQAAVFSGLAPETTYNFRIYPYTDSGSIDYKVDGTVPAVSLTTDAAPVVPDAPTLGLVYYRSANSFTVTWDLVDDATGYQLDVSESPTFTTSTGGVLLSENFDASTDLPTGWVNSGTANQTNSSHYSSAPNCRAFRPGDTLETPAVDNPVELEFNVDSSNGGNGKTATISYSIGGGSWMSLDSFTVSTSGSTETIDFTSSPDLSGASDVRFRFESTFFTWYLDDVSITGAAAPGFVSGYQGKAVGNVRFHAVEGLLPGTTYYFRVRAVDANGTSANSATGSVQTSASGTPFSYWATEEGLGAVSMSSDFESDSVVDFLEYAFATNPAASTTEGDLLSFEPVSGGIRVVHRQSIAPSLVWQYFGTQTLDNFGTMMSEGTAVGQYQIVSRTDQGPYDLVTLDVNTGSAEQYFFRIGVSEE